MVKNPPKSQSSPAKLHSNPTLFRAEPLNQEMNVNECINVKGSVEQLLISFVASDGQTTSTINTYLVKKKNHDFEFPVALSRD